ncbi:MAG TPA: metallophosphoesterase family protein [Syntrophales bacterium]|nr:metallophosphoesterase family protein [Syntrophales bacterium]
MKIGVISDTHLTCCDDRLTRLLHDYFCDVDLILHAGDLVDISVLDAFTGKDVKAVCGNMDPITVRNILPDRMILNINNYKVGLIHGWGMPFGIEKKILKEIGRVDCLVYGHTHKATNEVRNGVLFFNPGSATDKRFATRNTVGILEIKEKIKGTIIELNEL